MDRQSRSHLITSNRAIILVALCVLGACATSLPALSSAPSVKLIELTWLPASTDRVTAITREPVACLIAPETPDIAEKIRLGSLAFNSPALLGGQAEKKGLSCGSCHQNGRGNPNFQFEAVSGSPGTADVTSGLFSKVRADNTFNPLPIPDLARPEGADQVNRNDRPALAAFVKGQIEEEFSGDPTPEPVFEALLTYLEHIDGEASGCDLSAYRLQSWQSDWADAQMASLQASKAQPGPLKAYYTRTARISLRRLHDRYAAQEDAGIRVDLIQISRALEADKAWPSVTETDDLSRKLEAAAPRSLYSPERLSSALLGQTADF